MAPTIETIERAIRKVNQTLSDTDNTPLPVYDPTHPDADTQGCIYLPRINMQTKFIDADADLLDKLQTEIKSGRDSKLWTPL